MHYAHSRPKGLIGHILKRASIALCWTLFSMLFLLAGCSGPLSVKYAPGRTSPQPGLKEPVKIFVERFTDARGAKDPRAIGGITAVVSDMSNDRLTLTEDVSSLVTRAFAEELSSAGFIVSAGDRAGRASADLILNGEVKEFKLDIGARDEIAIGISAEFTEARSGKAVWSGVETVKESRYAGVMGNTSATISKYISASLSKVITKTIADASRSLPAKAGATGYPRAEAPAESAAGTIASGRISVASEPARAKVYIGGVYYGLTPVAIDLDPGVYDLSIRRKGHRENKEKVAVRPGQLTEVEAVLDKE
ncbi:MAG: PEGA domain-containing protein [Deltaproteobacteria bacterium]